MADWIVEVPVVVLRMAKYHPAGTSVVSGPLAPIPAPTNVRMPVSDAPHDETRVPPVVPTVLAGPIHNSQTSATVPATAIVYEALMDT